MLRVARDSDVRSCRSALLIPAPAPKSSAHMTRLGSGDRGHLVERGNLTAMAPWPERFTLIKDLTETRWIKLDSWVGMGSTEVTSVVPQGFEAYVRVFHPVPGASGPQRWSEIAKETGRTLHPLAQWKRIRPADDAGDVWNSPPEGEPPSDVLIPLVAILKDFTPDPSRCFFAIWDGWGQLHSGSFSSLRNSGQPTDATTPVEQFVSERENEAKGYPRFELEPGTGRPYLLGTGPLEVVLEISKDSSFERPGVPVAMWWPTDHSWFVASEIDFDSTLIGCSSDLRDALLRTEQLELLEVPPEADLSEAGDIINPLEE